MNFIAGNYMYGSCIECRSVDWMPFNAFMDEKKKKKIVQTD